MLSAECSVNFSRKIHTAQRDSQGGRSERERQGLSNWISYESHNSLRSEKWSVSELFVEMQQK